MYTQYKYFTDLLLDIDSVTDIDDHVELCLHADGVSRHWLQPLRRIEHGRSSPQRASGCRPHRGCARCRGCCPRCCGPCCCRSSTFVGGWWDNCTSSSIGRRSCRSRCQCLTRGLASHGHWSSCQCLTRGLVSHGHWSSPMPTQSRAGRAARIPGRSLSEDAGTLRPFPQISRLGLRVSTRLVRVLPEGL